MSIIGRDDPPKNIGIENDHVTLEINEKFDQFFHFQYLVIFRKNL